MIQLEVLFSIAFFDRSRVSRVKLSYYFCSVLFGISSWKDLRLNNVYKSFNFIKSRIWDEEQPEEIQELPLYPEKTTVWCGLWAGGIIGPYFFKNDAG